MKGEYGMLSLDKVFDAQKVLKNFIRETGVCRTSTSLNHAKISR